MGGETHSWQEEKGFLPFFVKASSVVGVADKASCVPGDASMRTAEEEGEPVPLGAPRNRTCVT